MKMTNEKTNTKQEQEYGLIPGSTKKQIKVSRKKLFMADMISALESAHGNIALAAKKLGVQRYTLWAKVQKSATLAKAYAEILEKTIDEAEDELYKLIKKGNLEAIKFFLTHKAKHRGWGDDSITSRMTININLPDDLKED